MVAGALLAVPPRGSGGVDSVLPCGSGDDGAVGVGEESRVVYCAFLLVAGKSKGGLGYRVVLLEEDEVDNVADSGLDVLGGVDETTGTTNSDLRLLELVEWDAETDSYSVGSRARSSGVDNGLILGWRSDMALDRGDWLRVNSNGSRLLVNRRRVVDRYRAGIVVNLSRSRAGLAMSPDYRLDLMDCLGDLNNTRLSLARVHAGEGRRDEERSCYREPHVDYVFSS